MNLSNGSAIGLVGAVIGIVGVASGGVGNIFFGAFGFGATNVADKHGMDGIERAMHVTAGLQNAINDGKQSMVQVSLSSATGQAWTGDGAEPQVTAFKNASGQVTAYVQSTGNSWKLSTADQQTSVTLTPSQTPGQPPQCVVNQVGKEPYSCVINEAGGTLTRQVDTGVNGSVDQTTQRSWLADNIHQTDTFVGPLAPNQTPTNPVNSSLSIGKNSFNLLDMGSRNDAEYGLYSLKLTGGLNASGQALSAAQLAALDANGDGSLSTTEAAGMRLWADLNENGLLDANELQGVGASLAAPALPAAPGYAGVPGIELSMLKALRGGQALPQALPVVPNISSANETNWRQAA